MSRRRVGLFYMIKRDQGKRRHGAAAYVAHLYRGLEACGYEPVVLRVGRGFRVKAGASDAGAGLFGDGLRYINVNVDAAVSFAKQFATIIAASHFQDYVEETSALLAAGVPWVVHGQANVPDADHPVVPHMRKAPIVAIRRTLQPMIAALGGAAVFLPHPYMRSGREPVELRHNAVACSRVDFAKHTDVIIEANTLLPEDKRIEVFGDINRMYAFHTLDRKYPGWRNHYRGEFELGDGVRLFAGARWAVDMTYWSNDRGGTQYTFFEAWDVGTPLVLHMQWYDPTEPTSRCAVFVASPSELAHVVGAQHDEQAMEARAQGAQLLAEHDAQRVARMYTKLWR